jgi:ABC-type multidrug transport system fused ATPase/permease subunit
VLIQKALGRLLEGRTSFIIAHRLSTVAHADRIVVMHHGRVVELGTHDELMNLQSFYYRLYTLSFLDGAEGATFVADLPVMPASAARTG